MLHPGVAATVFGDAASERDGFGAGANQELLQSGVIEVGGGKVRLVAVADERGVTQRDPEALLPPAFDAEDVPERESGLGWIGGGREAGPERRERRFEVGGEAFRTRFAGGAFDHETSDERGDR